MKEKQLQFCLLEGFDRCGSSMIARVLAHHPEVNLLFQPFNNTEVTKTQWQCWKSNEAHPETERFLESLLQGKIEHAYIQSDWFRNYSSSQEVKQGLNIIKDTKMHFKAEWLRQRFPEMKVYGIWRQPEEILHSLVRNGFHKTWYDYLTPELLQHAIRSYESLTPYAFLLEKNLAEYEVMAIGIALRTEVLLQSVSQDNWLVYENVVHEPNQVFNQFLKRFNLPAYDFSSTMQNDFNVAGTFSAEKTSWKDFFSAQQQQNIALIFKHLNNRQVSQTLIHE